VRVAERPVVVAGGGVWWAHAEDELRAVVERARLPLVVNGMARGMLPPSHPLLFSRARSQALREADVVLVIGARLDFRLNFGQPPVFGDQTRLIHIDVDRAPIACRLKTALGGLASSVNGRRVCGTRLQQLRATYIHPRTREEAIAKSSRVT